MANPRPARGCRRRPRCHARDATHPARARARACAALQPLNLNGVALRHARFGVRRTDRSLSSRPHAPRTHNARPSARARPRRRPTDRPRSPRPRAASARRARVARAPYDGRAELEPRWTLLLLLPRHSTPAPCAALLVSQVAWTRPGPVAAAGSARTASGRLRRQRTSQLARGVGPPSSWCRGAPRRGADEAPRTGWSCSTLAPSPQRRSHSGSGVLVAGARSRAGYSFPSATIRELSSRSRALGIIL